MSYVAFTPQSHDWYNWMFWLFLHTPRSFGYEVVFLRAEKVLNCLSKMHSTAYWRVQGFILQPSALLVMVENIFEALLVPGWIHCFSNNWCFFNYYNTSLLQNFNWVCSIGEGCFVTAAESGWWRWWRWSRSGQLGDLQKDWGVSEWNPWSVKCPWHEQVVWGQVWGGMLLYDGLKPRGWIDIWDCQWNEETSIFMNYNTKMSVLSVRSHRNFSEGDM